MVPIHNHFDLLAVTLYGAGRKSIASKLPREPRSVAKGRPCAAAGREEMQCMPGLHTRNAGGGARCPLGGEDGGIKRSPRQAQLEHMARQLPKNMHYTQCEKKLLKVRNIQPTLNIGSGVKFSLKS